MTKTGENPKTRSEGLIVRSAGDDLVVYDIKTDRASALSGAASTVFGLCDGGRDPEAIAVEIGEDAEIVRVALDRIARAGLLEDPAPFRVSGKNAPSRRERLSSRRSRRPPRRTPSPSLRKTARMLQTHRPVPPP